MRRVKKETTTRNLKENEVKEEEGEKDEREK